MSEVDPTAVPGDAPVDPVVAPDPVVQTPPVTITDEAGNVLATQQVTATDEAGNPVPVPPDVSPAHEAFAQSPDVVGDAPVAPADATPVVDVTDPVPAPVVEQTAPSNESATDPTADPIVPVVAEAQPDTPPTDNPDVYAQNLAANVAGSPVVPTVVEAVSADPRYVLRSEAQLTDLETASAKLLDAVRALCVAGLTRGQLRDSCTLAIEQLYVERNDAQSAGNADPYPTY